MTIKQLLNYQDNYSPSKLWEKLKTYAKSLGKETVYRVLQLYYVMVDKNTPMKYKAIIAGALGYLILPLDAIPDAIPVVGFSDDEAAIMAAYQAVKDCITPEIDQRARTKLSAWFK